MTLFDPYSHGRINELRQEQLARKARRRRELGLDDAANIAQLAPASAIRALLARVSRTRKAAPSAPRPAGRAALDS